MAENIGAILAKRKREQMKGNSYFQVEKTEKAILREAEETKIEEIKSRIAKLKSKGILENVGAELARQKSLKMAKKELVEKMGYFKVDKSVEEDAEQVIDYNKTFFNR